MHLEYDVWSAWNGEDHADWVLEIDAKAAAETFVKGNYQWMDAPDEVEVKVRLHNTTGEPQTFMVTVREIRQFVAVRKL